MFKLLAGRASDTHMQQINDEAILERAKMFCDQNATIWDDLTDYNRRRYLARAREQLLDEEASELLSEGMFRDPQSGDLVLFSLVQSPAEEHPAAPGMLHNMH
jgi:hypothetical protein